MEKKLSDELDAKWDLARRVESVMSGLIALNVQYKTPVDVNHFRMLGELLASLEPPKPQSPKP